MNDLAMFRGDDGTFDLALLNADGDALDLTDAADITFTVGDLFMKSLGAGIEIDPDGDSPGPSPTTGLIRVTVDAADTEDLPASHLLYPYAVRVEWTDGTVGSRLRGTFAIVPTSLPIS
jgi:hypothetical protein